MTVVVGKSVVRTDAVAKVRGGAMYGVDVRFGSMLVGKTLRAGIPHARIANLDTSAAARVPGVRAIVTGKDCSRRHGLFQKDQPALAVDRVRYAGEVVAAVAAEDEDAAQEAIERIAVDYEELPGVFDMMAAVAPGAPLIHPDQMAYERAEVTGLVLNPVPDSNVSYHFKLRRGDVDTAWSECDLVVEDTFSTQFVQYAHLEPHVDHRALRRDRRADPLDEHDGPAHAARHAGGSPAAPAAARARPHQHGRRRLRLQDVPPRHQPGGGAARHEGAEPPRAHPLRPRGRVLELCGAAAHADHHQDRRQEGRHAGGEAVDDLLGEGRLRRRRRGHRSQRELLLARALPDPQRAHRRLPRLHQPAARRRLPRPRHPAGVVGGRAADGPRSARARHEPARAPAQEHPGRG